MKLSLLPFYSLLSISILVSAAECKEASQPSLKDYTEGEKWVWKYKGETSQGEVRADGKDTKKIILKDGELAMETANAVIPLTTLVKKETSDTPRYNWPLKVGKKWKFEQKWTSEDGTNGMTSQDAEVISFKEEAVEAGTFMAYTIRYVGEISNSHGYKAKTKDVIVYAPELKTFIKLTQSQDDYEYVEELIEYSKK